MGILTLGLLGVAAVFPVGGWYMQKADIADRGSAIAQSVMNDIVARGMLNPGAWYVATPNPPPNGNSITSPNHRFDAIDGKYCPQRAPVPGSFTRPFAETLKEGLKLNPLNPLVLAKQFGNAYVIDPMLAATTDSLGNGNFNIVAYGFPAGAFFAYPWNSAYYGSRAWDPWRTTDNKEKAWPIRRVTYQQSNGWPLDKAMADSFCRGNDDLAYDFPKRDDRPAAQNWDTADVNGTQNATGPPVDGRLFLDRVGRADHERGTRRHGPQPGRVCLRRLGRRLL